MHRTYRAWFTAAAIYNLLWGAVVSIFPDLPFRLLNLPPSNYPVLWQAIGMMVMVYAPGYYFIARDPERYAVFVWIGLLGKLLGPLGFLVSAMLGVLPWRFGLLNLTNDVIWLPVFLLFAFRYAVQPLRELVQES